MMLMFWQLVERVNSPWDCAASYVGGSRGLAVLISAEMKQRQLFGARLSGGLFQSRSD